MTWYSFALLSAVFSALAAILEKKSLFKMGALEFSWKLSFYNLLFSLPYLYWTGFEVQNIMALPVLFGKSILGAFSFLFIMNGLKKLDISASLPLMIITPGAVAIMAFLFLGETLSQWEVIGMFVLLGGTFLLQTAQFGFDAQSFKVFYKWKAYRFLWLAVFIFTLTSLVDKLLVGNFKMLPMQFIVYQHLFIFIVFTAIMLVRKQPMQLLKNNENLKFILLISVATMVYRTSQIEAIKLGSVALVLTLKRTSVFFASLIGGTLFKESKLSLKLVAIAILILGSYFILK